MKKTAVLLAGLLLVSGTVFAEGWEVSQAELETTFNVVDSENGMNVKNGDIDFDFQLTKEVKEGASANIELAADEDGNDELSGGFEATEGDFSVSIAAIYNLGLSSKGLTVKGEDGNYIKWNVMGNADMVLGLHPYGVNTEWDEDTFEAFKTNNGSSMEDDGAVTLAITVNETTSATVTMVMVDGDTAENATALKVEGSTKAGDISINGYFATISEVTGVSTDQTAMGVAGSMPMGDLTLSGEFNTETIGDNDAKVGLFAKAALAMAEMNGYGRTAYAEFTSLNDQVDTAAGATTEIEAGLELTQGSFTVTPKVNIKSAENKVYGEDEKGTNQADSATTVGLTVAYSL
jgi:hypothetical protein